MVLILGIIYVFSIVMTGWGKKQVQKCDEQGGCEEEKTFDEEWGSLENSALSLMQILVYDDCFSLIRKTKNQEHILVLVLLCFLVIGAFTVLNMLIGVICEVVSETKR